MRASKAAHARAHNGDALSALGRRRKLLACGVVPGAQIVAIGCVTLQCADGDWLVDLAAAAVVFAGMRADAAQDISERVRSAGSGKKL